MKMNVNWRCLLAAIMAAALLAPDANSQSA